MQKMSEKEKERKEQLSVYEEYIKKLIKLIDENFKPIGLKDILKASEMFLATVIAFIILYAYIIILAPFTPISAQIPWALSFCAVVLAAASLSKLQRNHLEYAL